MNKSSIIIALLTTAMFLTVLVSYFNRRNDKDDYNLLRSNVQIARAELTIINAPGIESKKTFILSDRKELDSLNAALKKLGSAVKIDLAKENRVYAIIEVYKNNKKVPMAILNAESTGWVLIIGNSTFKSDYIFKLVEGHLTQ